MKIRNLALRLKSVSDTINGIVRDKLKVGAVEAPKYLNQIRDEINTVKRVCRTTPKYYINHVKDDIIIKKVKQANNWYTRVLGLDEVKLHQDRVFTLQKKLADVQEKIKNLALRLKAVSDTINGIVRDKLKVGAVEAPKYLNHIRDENTIVRRVCRTTPKYYINYVKDDIIVKKVKQANNWYTRVLGLDEVRFHQDRVFTLQKKLADIQEKRRESGRHLMDVSKKSKELQEELFKVERRDDLQRFLDLIKEETYTLKQKVEVKNQFNAFDREERETFTAYTNAVKDSYEKQRAQMEYTKYFGIIFSVVASFFTFCYSMYRKNDLKIYIDELFNGRKTR